MTGSLYTLNVSGEKFFFNKDQLQYEPENYFATVFFGGFSEAANSVQELKIEKEPAIFKLIQAHLRGYETFPIPDAIVPSYMTKEVFVKNISLEAQYYGLTNLEQKANKYLEEITVGKPKKYKYGVWLFS